MSSLVARFSDTVDLYGYDPSYAAAIVVGIVFLVLFAGHLFFLVRCKSWWMTYFVVGVLAEAIGYFMRRWSASEPTKVGAYIGTTLFIILAPAFLAASHYTTFGRLITFVGDQYSPIRATRVTKIFVTFDVLSFLIQGAGGGMETYASATLAKAVLVVGFVIQLISLAIFLVFLLVFLSRAKKGGEPKGPWVTCVWTIWVGAVLILVRSVYRLIEFASSSTNTTGWLVQHEAVYYALEALPIMLCCILLLVANPGRLIPRDRAARLSVNPFANPDTSYELVAKRSWTAGERPVKSYA